MHCDNMDLLYKVLLRLASAPTGALYSTPPAREAARVTEQPRHAGDAGNMGFERMPLFLRFGQAGAGRWCNLAASPTSGDPATECGTGTGQPGEPEIH